MGPSTFVIHIICIRLTVLLVLNRIIFFPTLALMARVYFRVWLNRHEKRQQTWDSRRTQTVKLLRNNRQLAKLLSGNEVRGKVAIAAMQKAVHSIVRYRHGLEKFLEHH